MNPYTPPSDTLDTPASADSSLPCVRIPICAGSVASSRFIKWGLAEAGAGTVLPGATSGASEASLKTSPSSPPPFFCSPLIAFLIWGLRHQHFRADRRQKIPAIRRPPLGARQTRVCRQFRPPFRIIREPRCGAAILPDATPHFPPFSAETTPLLRHRAPEPASARQNYRRNIHVSERYEELRIPQIAEPESGIRDSFIRARRRVQRDIQPRSKGASESMWVAPQKAHRSFSPSGASYAVFIRQAT